MRALLRLVPLVVRKVNGVLQQGYVDAQCCNGNNVRCEWSAPANMRALILLVPWEVRL